MDQRIRLIPKRRLIRGGGLFVPEVLQPPKPPVIQERTGLPSTLRHERVRSVAPASALRLTSRCLDYSRRKVRQGWRKWSTTNRWDPNSWVTLISEAEIDDNVDQGPLFASSLGLARKSPVIRTLNSLIKLCRLYILTTPNMIPIFPPSYLTPFWILESP